MINYHFYLAVDSHQLPIQVIASVVSVPDLKLFMQILVSISIRCFAYIYNDFHKLCPFWENRGHPSHNHQYFSTLPYNLDCFHEFSNEDVWSYTSNLLQLLVECLT